jgi:trigger factor
LKQQVMDALLKKVEIDAPRLLVEDDQARLIEMARQDLEQRGMPNAKTMPIPAEMFAEQAANRVKLGLILAELVKENGLDAKAEQVRAEVEAQAANYEDPQEVIQWYYSNPQRLNEVESFVLETNVVNFVASKAQITENVISFEELTAQAASAAR